VLKALFGDKPYQLNVTPEVLPEIVRSSDSFAAVEKEASRSRIYAGQHFPHTRMLARASAAQWPTLSSTTA